MNNKTISGMKCILYLFGLLALPVQAASFDCAKAATKVEKLICGDAALSKLDEELNAAYKAALQDGKNADTVKRAQKQWIKERNGCLDAACVKRAYEMRLSLLTVEHTSSVDGESTKQKETLLAQGGDWIYRNGEGRHEPLCQNLLKRLHHYDRNESMNSGCSWNVIASYPEFSVPPWEELDSNKYEDLIAKLEKYGQETPSGYFHRIPGLKEMASTEYYRRKAKDFIAHGGRLQVWRTKLSAFNPSNPKGNSTSPNEQTIVRMSGGFPTQPPSKELEEKLSNICKGMPRPDSSGEIYYVTSDLSGPDPAVEAGTFGIMSGHDLKIYEGEPLFVGSESIWRDSQYGLMGYCDFEFVKGKK